jgi:hypothetical protein
MRVALSPFASSISASAARPWSILCPAQLTASGNILGKVFLNGCPLVEERVARRRAWLPIYSRSASQSDGIRSARSGLKATIHGSA